MKNISPAFICFLMSALFVDAGSHSQEALPHGVKQVTSEKLRQKIADRNGHADRPPFETFVVDDARGQEIPIGNIPKGVLQEAESWIRQFVRSEWLPQDIPSALKARKDAVVREVVLSDGKTIYKDTGDFLTLEYELNGRKILLIESGRTLTARIWLPEERDLTKVTASDILKVTATYFTMPETAIQPDGIKIEGDDQLRSYRWIKGPTNEEISQRFATGGRLDWWFRLRVHFDGQTLLISIPEIPHPSKVTPALTKPDRF